MKKNIFIFCLLAIAFKSHSQSTYLFAPDTRLINDLPSVLKQRLSFEFKGRSVVGSPGSGNYCGLLTLAPWSDNSGGYAHQLNFNNGGVFYRAGSYLPDQWYQWRRLIIEDVDGNVSIGTTNPQGYKLAVAGNMIAESVKVKLQSAWPDYVFDRAYRPVPLSEIETFIRLNNHLPEIPSALQVKEEGLNLGDINAKLLKKIEELTLYLIDQQKEIQMLKEKVQKLENTK